MPKTILFLPIWGKLNETIPQQQMAALRKRGFQARYGLPGGYFPLFRSARAFRPELISLDWIHQYCLAPGLAASLVKTLLFVLDIVLLKTFFRSKLVWTIHNLQHHDPRPRGLERWISRFFASQCDSIRILGRGMEGAISEYLQVPESKLSVIPEGPYIGWYPEGQTQEEARKELKISPEKRVWLYLGTIRPYKGVENLMDAFLKLADPDLELWIAGNPWNAAYTQSLKERAAGHPQIHIHDQAVPDERLQTYFAAADLVVLPFKHVLNSGSALLAMGFSKAVVAPKIGLIPFRLSAQPELLFHEERSLEEVLKFTRSLSREDLRRIGDKNRNQALQYNWDDFARFIENQV